MAFLPPGDAPRGLDRVVARVSGVSGELVTIVSLNTRGIPLTGSQLAERYAAIGAGFDAGDADVVCCQEVLTYWHLRLLVRLARQRDAAAALWGSVPDWQDPPADLPRDLTPQDDTAAQQDRALHEDQVPLCGEDQVPLRGGNKVPSR